MTKILQVLTKPSLAVALFVMAAMATMLLSGCGVQRPYVWVEDLPASDSAPAEYRIAPGDNLTISVWGQTNISGNQKVRDDGNITVVLVGDLYVAGLTTTEAASKIAKQLEGDIVQNVRVDVWLTDASQRYITIVGEVSSPGKIELLPSDNLIDIIAKVGGFTDFSQTDEIYVLRNGEQMQIIRFDFDRMTTCPNAGINFALRDGDIVIVD